MMKKFLLLFMLIILLFTLCACHANPTQQQLYSKLIAHFERFGFSCSLKPLEAEREVPIYKANVWTALMLNEEELLVYFDDSNRADYLAGFVDQLTYGSPYCFGQRFVLVYTGTDASVLEALEAIENKPI